MKKYTFNPDNTFINLIKKAKCLQIVGPCKLGPEDINRETPTIFVDGGVKHLKKIRPKYYITLGDGDSSNSNLMIKFPIKKDHSDLSLALKIFGKYINQINFYGFFPSLKYEKRIDHYLANFGEIYLWSQKYSGNAFLNESIQLLAAGKTAVEIYGLFSLLSLKKNKLKITGDCEYQLKSLTTILPFDSRGISNMANGQIKIENQLPIFLISNLKD